jgi:glycosyltransferase involved in cell wall biosynthesis
MDKTKIGIGKRLLGHSTLISFGSLIGLILPWKNRSSLFFIFPFYQVGGGEKVHADIVNCVADQKPWVVFGDRSKDSKFKPLFQRSGARLFDISSLTKYRLTFHICAGALATLINRHSNAVVFGSNTRIFYHLLRYLKPNVRRIELLHSFGGGVERISLRMVTQIDTRVVINRQTRQDLEEQYAANDVNPEFIERVVLIENKVPIPDSYPQKRDDDQLKVLYVGRGAAEKRVHLVGKAATRCHESGIPAEFTLVGDVVGAIDVDDRKNCVFAGEIAELTQLEQLYDEADILVLTSSREGFPLVIMEGMAHGVVPAATGVGGIPFHVKHRVNGMIIRDDDENGVVCSLVEILQELASDRPLLRCLSRTAYEYAREHFGPATFCEAYRQLILGRGEKAEAHDFPAKLRAGA